MSYFDTIIKLANRFDLVDPRLYQAEDRSPVKGLKGAQRAVHEDIVNTAAQYHSLTQQAQQSAREAEVQKYLHQVARRLSKAVTNSLQESADLNSLRAEIETLKQHSKSVQSESGIRVRLNELTSFRITEAIIAEHAKNDSTIVPEVPEGGGGLAGSDEHTK